MVFRTGFLAEADGADLGWSDVPLQALHAEPAEAILRRGGGELRVRSRVSELEPATAARGPRLRVDGEFVAADAVIVAVPHDDAASLLPAGGKLDPSALSTLGASPILNLHVVFERRVTELPFFAAVGSPLQWAFDRSRAAGLERGQYLAVSLSAAGEYDGLSQEALRARFRPAFDALLPTARGARLLDFFVTREPAATFRQAPGTRALRPGPDVGLPGLFLAGAWTDTGWPATMEGAVRSGHAAARAALSSCTRSRRSA
jgi:hypothetical protein